MADGMWNAIPPHLRVALLASPVAVCVVIYLLVFGTDRHLRCEDAGRHNASEAMRRGRPNAVYRLTANRSLAAWSSPLLAEAKPRRQRPLVCCVTTTSGRIKRLQPVLLSMFRQRPTPTAIVVAPDVSVPWATVQDAAARWDTLASTGAPVHIARMPDGVGPLDKAWGCLLYAEHAALPPDAVLVVSDDDYKRGSGWLGALTSRTLLLEPEARRLVSFELPQYASSLRVRGSNGWAAHLSTFGRAAALYAFAVAVEPDCRCMDDVSIVGYMRGPRHSDVRNVPLSPDLFWHTKGVMAAGLQNRNSLHISMSAEQRLRMQRRCVRAMQRHDASVPDVLATDGRT